MSAEEFWNSPYENCGAKMDLEEENGKIAGK